MPVDGALRSAALEAVEDFCTAGRLADAAAALLPLEAALLPRRARPADARGKARRCCRH